MQEQIKVGQNKLWGEKNTKSVQSATMKIWDQNKYQQAWHFSSNIHKDQRLPGSDIPYINHLGLVAMEATAAVASDDVGNPDLLVLCAVLHDAMEDTPATYEEIKKNFGVDIANGILALTKNTELPSKSAQMQDSLCRIKKQPKEVWMVKLCDRITNLQPPPQHWDKPKMISYQEEAQLILENLGKASPFLAQRLNEKIIHYDRYYQKNNF